jgi:hypothetical protein
VPSREREAELLPVPYYHVVFTLPAPIGDIAYQNKAVIYDILFKASAECRNPRRARRASTGQRGARPDTQFGPQFDRSSLVGDAAIDRSNPHMRLDSLNESVRSSRTNSNPSSAVLKSP